MFDGVRGMLIFPFISYVCVPVLFMCIVVFLADKQAPKHNLKDDDSHDIEG